MKTSASRSIVVFALVAAVASCRGSSPRGAAGLMTWGLRHNVNHVTPSRYALVRHRLGFTVPRSVPDAMAALMRVPDVEDKVRASGVPATMLASRS